MNRGNSKQWRQVQRIGGIVGQQIPWLVLLGVLGTSLIATRAVMEQTPDPLARSYWIFGAMVIGGCLTSFVVGNRYTHLPPAPGRVLCIVPTYNEPPDVLQATVESLLAQTVPVDVVVIDDGSSVPVIPSITHPRLQWIRQENTGKRGAQVAVLRSIPQERYDFILTVDSDSQPYPDACEHLCRAMSDPSVEACTGMIYVRNHRESWISMAADLDIGSSCVMMRASRSLLGALETTSGALAMYRSALIYDHLEAYAVECGTGDDRWLALRALQRGKVVAVAEAGVETQMPTSLKGTYRQRLRWARSWYWMLPFVARNLSFRQMISPVYGLIQLCITPLCFVFMAAQVVSLLRHPGSENVGVLGIFIASYAVVRFGLGALYIYRRPNVTRADQARLLLLGVPVAVGLNLILLLPTRYWAIARLRDNRWRSRVVSPGSA